MPVEILSMDFIASPPQRTDGVVIRGAKKKECAIAQYGNVRVLSTG